LVLVLIMTVVSALAVSLATRSTIDTRIQQNDTKGVEALISAQTGLEQMVINPSQTTIVGDTYSATKTDVDSDNFDVGRVETGSSVDIGLNGADFSKLSGLVVYWGPDKSDPTNQPAVFVSVVKNDGTIVDYAYDYSGNNGFVLAQDDSTQGLAKKTPTIPVAADVIKVRITVLDSAALVKIFPVGPGASLPPQITSIKSVGSVNSGSNTVKYGLQYDESANDTVPGVFDYAVFSGGSIIQ